MRKQTWRKILNTQLPNRAWITRLIILDLDRENLHGGPNILLAKLRERYWVTKGRRFVRHVIHSPKFGCLRCRKERTKPYGYPDMPYLSTTRVREARPFLSTGVDYFGPLKVKEQGINVKIYVALFTCLVVRAIHLEPAEDYSAESFIRAFRRFGARRGIPELIVSDRGTNFILGAKSIQRNWTEILFPITGINASQMAHKGITWEIPNSIYLMARRRMGANHSNSEKFTSTNNRQKPTR